MCKQFLNKQTIKTNYRVNEIAQYVKICYNLDMKKSPNKYEKYIQFAKDTLLGCSNIILKWHEKESPDSTLYLNEYVAKCVNEYIQDKINEIFPNHFLFTKGSRDIGDVEYEWICDPLDGAFIYSKGFTSCVISMTLVHNGSPIIAVIYQPFTKDFYIAIDNEGVYKNNQRIHVSHEGLKEFGCIEEEWWPDAYYDVDHVVHNIARDYRMYPLHFGSVVYSACLIAESKLTATLFGGRLVGKNHEAAAVMLLMKEAGGKYTDLTGRNIDFKGTMHGFIISTTESHPQILESVKKYLETPIA